MVGNRLVLTAASLSCRAHNTHYFLLHFSLDALAITRVGCLQQHGGVVTLTSERR